MVRHLGEQHRRHPHGAAAADRPRANSQHLGWLRYEDGTPRRPRPPTHRPRLAPLRHSRLCTHPATAAARGARERRRRQRHGRVRASRRVGQPAVRCVVVRAAAADRALRRREWDAARQGRAHRRRRARRVHAQPEPRGHGAHGRRQLDHGRAYWCGARRARAAQPRGAAAAAKRRAAAADLSAQRRRRRAVRRASRAAVGHRVRRAASGAASRPDERPAVGHSDGGARVAAVRDGVPQRRRLEHRAVRSSRSRCGPAPPTRRRSCCGCEGCPSLPRPSTSRTPSASSPRSSACSTRRRRGSSSS